MEWCESKKFKEIFKTKQFEYFIQYVIETEKQPEYLWNWNGISRNPSLTMEFLEKHLNDTRFDWYVISINPSLTMEFVEKHSSDLKFDWDRISRNSNIPITLFQRRKLIC